MAKVLSFTDAAERVLRERGEPVHYKEIVKEAISRGLISTKGLTPEATLIAVIVSENRRLRARGEEPRFVSYGQGMYGLAKWEKGLPGAIRNWNQEVKAEVRALLLEIEPEEFEQLIGRLLTEMGFEDVEVTKRSGDGGVDLRGELVVGGVVRTRMAVQVKRWKNNVQTPVITQLRGSLGPHEQGLVITTSDFSEGARKEASDPYKMPIALMNGQELVGLMAEYRVGIKRTDTSLLELDEEVFPKPGPSDEIKVFARSKGKLYEGELIKNRMVRIGGKVYESPSGAARAICGYPVDGWRFWRYRDPKTGKVCKIERLRGRPPF